MSEQTGGPVPTNDESMIVSALAAKYPLFAVATIERWVAGTTRTFQTAPIRKYIPVLVQRSVDATLRELTRADGTSADLPTVARLSTVTSGR